MADVFTNDLRIREQAVGANSNLWGGYLNTSLENIAEAFSYGTEALADSATQTLTLADGASDELRSFYVKLTGTLSQATTVTLAPNTISKVWMIENATSGGYDVTISQGSGANVTVGNGNVKMIATDGAGAGAVVYDLLTDLELAGNVSITTTDNTSNLTLISTDADASAGPKLDLFRDSGSPADDDILGKIRFLGDNDSNSQLTYADIEARIVDASNGSEDGRLELSTALAGSGSVSRIFMDATETIINNDSKDLDFRVESDGNANMLVVDAGTNAVGVGVSPSGATFHVVSSGSGVKARFSDNTSETLDIGITSDSHAYFNQANSGPIAFQVGGSEKFRINNNGQFLVGRTTDDVDTIGGMIDGNGIVYSSINETTYNTFLFRAAQSANAYRFYVAGSGQVNSTFTSISSISDARLKENVRDYEAGGLAEILKLQPRVFDWKENEGKNIKNDVGFIAQEFEEVFPDWVSNFLHDDLDDAKTVSASELIFPMVNAFKEISAEIESLKAEVAALKGA